ncbi:MAG: hypothetical protein WCV88_00105 [Patescibacteria group bacterium]
MDDLEGKDLQWAYWFNTHKDQVYTALYGVGIAAVSILWLVNIVLLVIYLVNEPKTNTAINELGTTNVIYDSIKAPEALIIKEVKVLPHTSAVFDVYAIVTNPNSTQVGNFTYTFNVLGKPYTFKDGVILPGETIYLVANNISGQATTQTEATLVPSDVTWHRVRGPQIQTEFTIKDIKVGRTNLSVTTAPEKTTIENINSNTNSSEFATPETNTNTPPILGETITQLTSTLTNASAYGFKKVIVTAVIKDSTNTIVGIQQQVLTNVASFQDYPLAFNWRRLFEATATGEVTVTTNVRDSGNLILP